LGGGNVVLASISARGHKAMGAYDPSPSEDGAVAFHTLSRLVQSDRDGLTDVYVSSPFGLVQPTEG
jgi:hypothetical protein